MGQMHWETGLLKVEGRSIKQDPIPYVEQLEFPIDRWLTHPLVHGFVYGHVMLCVSLPTMEKLSSLV